MTQEFLLHGGCSAESVQERRITVVERVPADVADALCVANIAADSN